MLADFLPKETQANILHNFLKLAIFDNDLQKINELFQYKAKLFHDIETSSAFEETAIYLSVYLSKQQASAQKKKKS